MNGYQLADKLDEYNKDGMPVLVISQAVDMLRQQQAEIERLTQENCDLWEQLNDGKASEK